MIYRSMSRTPDGTRSLHLQMSSLVDPDVKATCQDGGSSWQRSLIRISVGSHHDFQLDKPLSGITNLSRCFLESENETSLPLRTGEL